MKITSRAHYEQLMAHLLTLIKSDPPLDSVEGQELDALANDIEAYERIHFPIAPPSAEAAAEFRRDQETL